MKVFDLVIEYGVFVFYGKKKTDSTVVFILYAYLFEAKSKADRLTFKYSVSPIID